MLFKKNPQILKLFKCCERDLFRNSIFFLGFLRTDTLSENQQISISHSQNFCVPPKHFPEGEARKRSQVYVIIDLDVTYLIF